MENAPLVLSTNFRLFDSAGFDLTVSNDPLRMLMPSVGSPPSSFDIMMDMQIKLKTGRTISRTCYCQLRSKDEAGGFKSKLEFKWDGPDFAAVLSTDESLVSQYIIDGICAAVEGVSNPNVAANKDAAQSIQSISPKTVPPPSDLHDETVLPPYLNQKSGPKRWPAPQDFSEALQDPSKTCWDKDLQCGKTVLNVLGLPKVASGMFASVFELTAAGKKWAVRCFNNHPSDQHDRYQEISHFILSDDLSYTVNFAYLDKGVRIDGIWYPVLKMDWAPGITLDAYLAENLTNRKALVDLRSEFQTMMNQLYKCGVAHGDLQHGNILVDDSRIYLVDYDGFYVPALAAKESRELGHINYQHPSRTAADFGPYLDNFSAWLIDFTLLCLIEDPQLWQKYQGGDECLLIRKRDLLAGDRSSLFAVLLKHQSEKIRSATTRLLEFLKMTPAEVPPLDSVEPNAESQTVSLAQDQTR